MSSAARCPGDGDGDGDEGVGVGVGVGDDRRNDTGSVTGICAPRTRRARPEEAERSGAAAGIDVVLGQAGDAEAA